MTAHSLPYMPRYTRDFRDGTRHMTFEQKGFYSDIIDALWEAGGSLPDDKELIARRLVCNPRSVAKLLPQMIALGKLKRRDGKIVNARVVKELDKANTKAASKRRADDEQVIHIEAVTDDLFAGDSRQSDVAPQLPSNSRRIQRERPQKAKQNQRPSPHTQTQIHSINNASNSMTPTSPSACISKDDLIELGGKGERPPSSKHAPPEARGLARLGISIAERTVTPHVSAELARKHGIKPASMRTFESRFWAWNDKKPSAERARDADAVFASWLGTHLKRLSQVDCIRLLEPGSDLVLKATGLGERAKREGWYVELGEWCRRHGRIPIGKEIDTLIGDAMRAATDALPAMPNLKPVKASRELAQALGALGNSILAKAAGNRVSA